VNRVRNLIPAVWLLSIWLLLPMVAAAVDVDVTAAVDRQRVAVNEPVKLTLSISSDRQLGHVSAPKIDLGAFVVYGPAISVRTNIVNRQTSFSRDLVYTLYARRQGRHTIGAASIVVEGQMYTTDPIRIEVAAARKGGSSKGAASKSGETAESDELSDNLYLRATLDRDTVYVNEQVTVSFELCYRYNLRDVGFTEIPTFSGFWSQELFVAQRLDPEVEQIGNRQFHVAPLRRMALFPTRDGRHEIDVMAVTCAIPQRRQRRSAFDAFSLFDDPLFGRTQNVMVRSVALPVVARSLPQTGRPDDFGGLVGQLHVEATAQPRQVAVGDPVTLRLKVIGTGNMQSLSAPVLEVDGLKIYEPKGDMEQTVTPEGRLGGQAIYEYIVIPERPGAFEIPSVGISYFDPESRRYERAASVPIRLRIEGGAVAAAVAPVHDMTRSEIEELGSDVRHIKPDIAELQAPSVLYRQPLFWILQVVLPLGYMALVFVRRHQERLQGDQAYARRRGANTAARRRLQEAADLVEAPESRFFQALHAALVSFIADHVNEPAPGLDRERCRSLLLQRQVPAPAIDRLDTLLQTCEEGRFAQGQTSASRRRNILQESESLIEELREVFT
jgi:hypothetical protein